MDEDYCIKPSVFYGMMHDYGIKEYIVGRKSGSERPNLGAPGDTSLYPALPGGSGALVQWTNFYLATRKNSMQEPHFEGEGIENRGQQARGLQRTKNLQLSLGPKQAAESTQ